ncbi:hypothetical protein PIIN_07500 [Serendipita indica DSM 11827]|uniref:Uncharacterized protein n=1 Tax=Serendipita indica (strain DSM 11827) TaxID=1109443 RepID=G4TQF4_SERID|nr:hypothetical protein PIIN_07500 [Serendipita indica DSM 11827]
MEYFFTLELFASQITEEKQGPEDSETSTKSGDEVYRYLACKESLADNPEIGSLRWLAIWPAISITPVYAGYFDSFSLYKLFSKLAASPQIEILQSCDGHHAPYQSVL